MMKQTHIAKLQYDIAFTSSTPTHTNTNTNTLYTHLHAEACRASVTGDRFTEGLLRVIESGSESESKSESLRGFFGLESESESEH